VRSKHRAALGRGLAAGPVFYLLMLPAVAFAQNEQWQVGSAPSFSSGKYGTDERTDVIHTPFTARRLFEDGDVTLVFPFTCIRGRGDVTVVNGSPVRTEQTRSNTGTPGRTSATDSSRRTGGSADTTRATDSTAATATVTPVPPATDCGVGDIIVRGRYYILDERGWLPTLALRGHVKTPTASVERGLGTGRFDEGIGIEVSRTVGRGFVAMGDGGYTIIGQPADVEFANSWWYDIGVGQTIGNVIDVSAFYEESGAIVAGLAGARELITALTVKTANGWRLQLTGQLGLSDGAPDHGITVGASRRF
jgi:hypothetical protein